MRCCILNMPSATKRLKRTIEELKRCCPGMMWSIPKMCIASEWSNGQYERFYDVVRGRRYLAYPQVRLSAGEVACALSHQSAMREFLNSEDDSVLIVEDDVCLSSRTGEFLDELGKWLKRVRRRPMCVVLTNPVWARRITAKKWFAGYKYIRPIEAYGGVAYVLNRAGAELILKVNHIPIVTTSDRWAFYRSHGLDVYCLDAPLAGTYDVDRSDSSLSAGRAETVCHQSCNQYVWKRIVAVLKRKVLRLYYALTLVKNCGGVTNFGSLD